MDDSLKRFRSFAKLVRIFLNISFWICIIGVMILIFCKIALLFISNDTIITELGISIPFKLSYDNIVQYNITNDVSIGDIEPILNLIILIGIIYLIVFCIIVKQLTVILKSVEKGNPFNENNSLKLKVIGTTLIIASLITPICDMLLAIKVIQFLNINIDSFNYSINLTMLFSGLLILLLSGVFRYGSKLQEEYDLTI
ncbi:MAG: DUF2975 domain-containing protein [Eubacteriales bacterium]